MLLKSINSFSLISIILKNSMISASIRAKEGITNLKGVIGSLIVDLS